MTDPVTFAVIKAGLDTIVDDMAYAVMRTARSPIVRDVLDYSATLCDRAGPHPRPGQDRGAASRRRAGRHGGGAGAVRAATSSPAT